MTGPGADDPDLPKNWEFFEQMSFLLDQDRHNDVERYIFTLGNNVCSKYLFSDRISNSYDNQPSDNPSSVESYLSLDDEDIQIEEFSGPPTAKIIKLEPSCSNSTPKLARKVVSKTPKKEDEV